MRRLKNLVKRWNQPKTLVGICSSRLIVYAIFTILLFQVFIFLADMLWRETFPEIDDYVSYSSQLKNDEFMRIPENQFKNCGILIYSEKGRIMYSSDQDLRAMISPEEIQFIPDMQDTYTYRILQGENDEVWIFKVDKEFSGSNEAREFCRLDAENNIIEGSLFSDIGKLNKRTRSFLQGIYSQNLSIFKYKYTNVNEKPRTLVFLAPIPTGALMEEYKRKEITILFFALGADILGAIAAAIAIARKVRNSILPMNVLFEQYSDSTEADMDVVIPGELKSIEQNFLHLTERLERANSHRLEMEREKNRMIADLSHDLKSPLTVISGYAQALAAGKVDAQDVQRYLSIIKKKAANSVEMINNLMQYATMEHPDYRPNKEKTDFCEFLRMCLIGRYEEMEEKEIGLELEIPEEEVFYEIDRRIMGSVMENLINNTIRYNDAGTTIFVSLEVLEKSLRVTYADTGVGIPEEIRKDVFKPFVIGNQARTSTKGTGIGMSIIKRGVEMNGGRVELLDPEGSSFSTIFEMTFPLA